MEDLISGKAALDILDDFQASIELGIDDYAEKRKALCDLPSEQPKPGKWKFTKYYFWECSQCKKSPTKGFGYVQGKDELFDFCPNCGADMRGGNDEIR